MPSLIIQHPALADAPVAAFAEALGRPPDSRERAVAAWRDATIGREAAARLADAAGIDAAIVADGAALSDYRIAAFDMDSTLITIECVDEIADFVGRKAEVAAITEAAMRGEIADYNESLRRRVALLAGLPEDTLQRVWDERVRMTPGAERLVATMKACGLKILLVSGGFTFFTERLKARLDIDFTRSNTLEVADGRLTGRLVGRIVNASGKREALERSCAAIGCTPSEAIAVGDGANDLEMMGIAGVSVAFRAKPIVRAQTTFAINHGGLDTLLGWLPPHARGA
jgi:phosphoserine phosphatase